MYSVIVHKATHKPFVAFKDLSLSDAKTKAEELYGVTKLLVEHGTCTSGVSVLVMPSDKIEAMNNLSILDNQVYQCGGF